MNQPPSSTRAKIGNLIGLGITLVISYAFVYVLGNHSASPGQPAYPGPGTQAGLVATSNGPARKETEAASRLATQLAWTPDPHLPTPDKSHEVIPTPGPPEFAKFLQRSVGAGRIVEGLQVWTYKSTLGFVPTNIWIEKTADKYIVVYAGEQLNLAAGGTSENQGALFIEWRTLDTQGLTPDQDLLPGGAGLVRTPSQNGNLVIADAVGERLILHALDGTTFVFDVAAQTFVTNPGLTIAQRHTQSSTIIESGHVPFTKSGARFWNQWVRPQAGGGQIAVFAGVENQNPTELALGFGKGFLAVVDSKGPPTTNDKVEIFYPPLEAYGPLRIFDATDNQITLIGNGSGYLVFDVSARRFLAPSEMNLALAPIIDNQQ